MSTAKSEAGVVLRYVRWRRRDDACSLWPQMLSAQLDFVFTIP